MLEVRRADSVHRDRWGFLDCRDPWVRKGLQVPMARKVLLDKMDKLDRLARRDLRDRLDLWARLREDRCGRRICSCRPRSAVM